MKSTIIEVPNQDVVSQTVWSSNILKQENKEILHGCENLNKTQCTQDIFTRIYILQHIILILQFKLQSKIIDTIDKQLGKWEMST